MCLNLNSKTFSLHPIQIYFTNNQPNIFKTSISRRKQYFWLTLLILSFTKTTIELYHNLNCKNKNLLSVLFHLFLLLSKFTAFLWIFVFNVRSSEIIQMLRYFCLHPVKFVEPLVEKQSYTNAKTEFKFNCFIIIGVISLYGFYMFFIPICSLFYPCLHSSLSSLASCSNTTFRVTIFMFQIFVLAPVTSMGCTGMCICLVTKKEFYINLEFVW